MYHPTITNTVTGITYKDLQQINLPAPNKAGTVLVQKRGNKLEPFTSTLVW